MTAIRLRLYVTGRTAGSERARAALADLEAHLTVERGSGAVISEIIDVLATPELAERDDVFATPTIARIAPGPRLKLFGDLSSMTKVLAGLELDRRQPTVAESPTARDNAAPWTIIASGISSSLVRVRESAQPSPLPMPPRE